MVTEGAVRLCRPPPSQERLLVLAARSSCRGALGGSPVRLHFRPGLGPLVLPPLLSGRGPVKSI